ncbi:hypothetical protein [Nostoc sp. C052]|uniref:hypothetical protein n=1 Tax=Nostoc sp. C052 TaxID=2576902 RepID=UPI0015C3CC2F|nr:hypothetical protein [Nostoc sp. C052]
MIHGTLLCDRSTAKTKRWSHAEHSKNSPQFIERCVGVARRRHCGFAYYGEAS